MDTNLKVHYDLTGSFLDAEDDLRSLVRLTLTQTQRCLHRSPAGYERLLSQRPVSPFSQIAFQIPVEFLASRESCSYYLDCRLSELNFPDTGIHGRLLSEIPEEAVKLSRHGLGFLVDVDMEVVEQSLVEETEGWNKMDSVGGGSLVGDGGVTADLSCAICLEELSEAEGLIEMPCSHLFHKACIFHWLRKNQSCPLCRARVW